VRAAELEARLVDTPDGFLRLRDAWNTLTFRLDGMSPFQAFGWAWAWWTTFGQGTSTLAIVVLSRGSAVAGIVPLVISPEDDDRGPTAVLLGRGPSDYLNWLVPRDDLADALLATRHLLAHLGVRSLYLTDLPPESPLRAVLEGAARRGQVAASFEAGEIVPRVVLPSTWPAYRASRSANTREALRRHDRKIALRGGAHLTICTSAEELPTALAVFLRLHRGWWTARERESVLAADGAVRFLTHGLDGLAHLGLLQLSIRWNGRDAISAFVTLVMGARHYYYLSGINPAYRNTSPGVGHMAAVVRHAIEERATVLDLLRGDEPYKRCWATNASETWACRLRLT
jgi:CelD/BcsL family acetyltransferase involved in cellulose biosynthesis